MKNLSSFARRALLTTATLLTAAALVGCGGGQKKANTGGDDNGSDNGSDTSGGGDKAEIGSAAPEVAGDYVQGDGPKNLKEAKGTVTIIDFWATFCQPCRKSFPAYQQLVDKHAGDLAVIAVSVDDPEEASSDDVKKFADDLGVSFTILWDGEGEGNQSTYNPPSMPTSYIIDKEGVLRHIHPKYEAGDAEKIDEQVTELINK